MLSPGFFIIHPRIIRSVYGCTHHFLLQGEYVVVEEFVQFLVCVIYAELLKGIHGKILKAKDVEHAQESAR